MSEKHRAYSRDTSALERPSAGPRRNAELRRLGDVAAGQPVLTLGIRWFNLHGGTSISAQEKGGQFFSVKESPRLKSYVS